ncbi:hypothetical protein TRP8649_00914 [Pelagimonas phthalicica]|uniref:Uncharacterized protein n=1 Tax=Pelagimonas phthalicica TaxID=1037362 RepID=A0A238JA49_9RHOB|nr:hypothetical protein CLV87_1157 [Pelagimonas phthalicica]SMX26822.1 hypothetical protein TRP8649_00914 [Pelagimonas phthalicica]
MCQAALSPSCGLAKKALFLPLYPSRAFSNIRVHQDDGKIAIPGGGTAIARRPKGLDSAPRHNKAPITEYPYFGLGFCMFSS